MSKKMYDLTNPQKNILSIERYYSGTSLNTNCGVAQINQIVDFEKLSKAITLLIKNNSIFSLKFEDIDGTTKQWIDKPIQYTPKIHEIKNRSSLTKLENELSHKALFASEHLFEFQIFKFPNNHGGVIGIVHHLLSDSWGVGLMFDEILKIYNALIAGSYEDTESNYHYTDYIEKEQEYLKSGAFEKDKEFWNDLYKTVPEVVTLPSITKSSMPTVSCAADRKACNIGSDLLVQINNFCKENKISVYNFFMAIFAIYIGNMASSEDFVIGTPILNRLNFADKHTMGMFVSTVPFRIQLDKNISFCEFSQSISLATLSMLRHQRYPYENLLQDLRKSNPNIPNLYNIILSYQITKLTTGGLNCTSSWGFNGTSADDLQIHIVDYDNTGSLDILYDYKTDKYSSRDIENMHERICHIIEEVLSDEKIKIHDIEIVTEQEKSRLLYDFNNTKLEYPRDKTISELFEEQAKKTPNNIALVFEDQKLTYKELNERANSLAFYLRSKGIQPNDIVGIMVTRSLEMIVSILAVLKSGACYVPIDPTYPQDRIEYMLENSNAKMLLTFKNLQDKVNFKNKIFIELNNDLYNFSKSNLKSINTPEDLAYMIYTSGSTGKPKGVMLTHRNVNNFICGMMHSVDFSSHKTIVSVTTVSFDIFVLESLLPLQNGLTVVIANENEQNDIKSFNKLCMSNNVNIIQTTPSRFQILLSDETQLSYIKNLTDILIGGEALPEHLLKQLQDLSNSKIYNVYGPTETTVWSTIKDITNSTSISIGKPIANTTCYILNKHKKILPVFTPGNLYIGGDGVAKGYYKREDLTSNKFIKNPYIDETIYDTGDLAYFTDSGELVHLGRSDYQIKINGHRIELGEIENLILQDTSISNCVVVSKLLENNRSCLCAYYTSKDNDTSKKQLRVRLQKNLPNYMVPQYFVNLDKFPYTPNGKIDRKKLPLPKMELNRDIIPPRNDTDLKLINLLKQILNVNSISIDDSFFEIGGDSLSAINLCSKVYSLFNVQLHIKDIFDSSHIRDISDLIMKKAKVFEEKISISAMAKSYPASYAQSRIYLSSKISGNNSILYNISGGLLFNNPPDVEKLESAFKLIIKNQSSFRTSFKLENNFVSQIVTEEVPFTIDISDNSISESEIDTAFNAFNTPFDLDKAPLLKVKLIPVSGEKALLMVVTHHIVCDGASLNILLHELEKAYNTNKITTTRIDYKDYSIWERKNIESGNLKEAEDYWINRLTNLPPTLDIKSKTRSTLQAFSGNKVLSSIDAKTTIKIKDVCKKIGITPYMLMLSVYYILLYKYTMQNDIIIGTPLINRISEDLDNIIGMFVNTLPIRTSFSSDLTFANFAKVVKDNCIAAYKYQSYPFDKLVSKLNVSRSLGKNPLFNTTFVYQNKYYVPNFQNLDVTYYIPKTSVSKFDLSLEVLPTDDGLDLSFEYSTKLFDDDFIIDLANHYINILETILDNINIKIANISMLSQNDITNIYKFYNLSYPKQKSIAELFEAQVNQSPDEIALVFGTEKITYNELNIRANRFGNYLLKKGIKTGDIVSVLLPRSIDLIVSMLALNKIGAAYLPLSVDYPIDRIQYILNHSKAKMIITNTVNSGILYENLPSLDIDTIDDSKLSSKNISSQVNPDDILYILYTSGSTGTPKGVMVTNNNLNNFIHSFNSLYGDISSKDRLLASTNICFDVSIFEFYISLLNGAVLYLYDENIINDIFKYCNTIIDNNITMLYIPPNILEEVYNILHNSQYKKLNKLLIGVEPIKTKVIKQYYNINKDMVIVNGYGPTETTICTTAFLLNNSSISTLSSYDIIPIGKAIHNTKLFVLDNDLNPMPQNIPGELYVSGENVSKGYLNDKNLTQKSFFKYMGNTVYKTGDIVVLDKNGNLNFIGRNDSQIKVNGHRIELGEIEKNMYLYPGITKAVILANEQSKIVAYFTASSNINITDLRLFLQTKLPLYYIPNFFVEVDKFKLTANGKIDKKSLQKIKLSASTDYEAPSTDDEKKLVKIFESILNTKKIGINNNFFDMGGDSLSAIKLQIEAFNQGLNISYKDIFEFPTIKQLAQRVSHKVSYQTTSNYDYTQINNFLSNDVHLEKIHKEKVKNILLTGATGFVGSHILDSLLKHTRCKVYCLVRPEKTLDTYTKVIDKLHFYFGNKYDKLIYKRLFIIEGDIIKQSFGIPISYLDKLGKTIDCVINSAAISKHYGKNSLFNETNITGTQNIIDFCKKFNCKLLHISTLSVSGNMFETQQYKVAHLPSNISFTEKSLFIGQDLSNVYVATKFFAERLILENIIQHQLNAKIIRLGNITNRYSDGKFQINISENAFLNRIKSFLKIGAIPDYITNGYIEFTPVDFCAEAIVKIALAKSNLTIFHVYNNNHITFIDLISLFHKYGIKIDVVSEEQFLQKIKDILKNNKSNLSGIINDFDFKKRLNYKSQIKISNNITNDFLKKLSFRWPKIDSKYIKKYITYLKSIHYLANENYKK